MCFLWLPTGFLYPRRQNPSQLHLKPYIFLKQFCYICEDFPRGFLKYLLIFLSPSSSILGVFIQKQFIACNWVRSSESNKATSYHRSQSVKHKSVHLRRMRKNISCPLKRQSLLKRLSCQTPDKSSVINLPYNGAAAIS